MIDWNSKQNSWARNQLQGQWLSLSCFCRLQQYPNKTVLSRAKKYQPPAANHLFDQRCALLAELWSLLLWAEEQQATVYLSKGLFISHKGSVFMLYSLQSGYQDRLRAVPNGKLVQNIAGYYRLVLLSQQLPSEGPLLEDFEHNAVLRTTDSLVLGLQKGEHLANSFLHTTTLTHPKQLLAILQESTLFLDYHYYLKWRRAVLVGTVLDELEGRTEVLFLYRQMGDSQIACQRSLSRNETDNQAVRQLQEQALHFLKLLQAQNCLRIVTAEQESGNWTRKAIGKQVLALDFSANLKKIENWSITQENSSESSVSVVNEEDRDTVSNRFKECQEGLNNSKNEINFKVRVAFLPDKNTYLLRTEAQTLWHLEDFYFHYFTLIWQEFAALWTQTVPEAPFTWTLARTEKNPGLEETNEVPLSANLIRECLCSVDRLLTILLLFQQVLKDLFKASQNLVEFQEVRKRISTPNAIAQEIAELLRATLAEHARLQRQLTTFETKS